VQPGEAVAVTATFVHLVAPVTVVGAIAPPGLSPGGVQGIAFDDDPDPVVIDGWGGTAWRISATDAGALVTYSVGAANTRSLARDGARFFTVSNTSLTSFDLGGGATVLGTLGQFNFLSLALDPQSSALWMANDCTDPGCTIAGGGELWRVDASNGSATFAMDFSSANLGQATALAIGPGGTFFLAASSSTGSAHIWAIDPTTGASASALAPSLPDLDLIMGMAFDPAMHALYFIDEQRSAEPRTWALVRADLR
jgi:hypothetical protein